MGRNIQTRSVLRIVLCISAIVNIAKSDGNTVYDALSRNPELLEFQKMVNKDEVLSKLLQHWPVTVFAPTNEAVNTTEKWLVGRENKVVSYHVMNLLANKELFPFSSTSSLAGAPPLYLNVKTSTFHATEKEYYVNNAKILKTESYTSRDGNAQVLCIIDEVLLPYLSSSSLPPTALELLSKPERYGLPSVLEAFAAKVRSEDSLKEIFNRDGNHTFFLPLRSKRSDNFIREQLIDQWVIQGHVIPKNVLFTRLTSHEMYRSEAFRDEIQVDLAFVLNNEVDGTDKLYAQSNTIFSDYGHKKGAVQSRIVRANVPVKNGVVHFIGQPLMIIDTSVWDYISDGENAHISDFLKLVDYSPEFKELLMNSRDKTLFVPSNEAIRQLSEDTVDYIKANLSSFLKIHLVMHSVSMSDVEDGKTKEIMSIDNITNLHFGVHRDAQSKWLSVEGGGVKAIAVHPDIGAIDGIVHVIDRFLGIPYQTIYQKLQTYPDLRITYDLGEQDGWSNILNNHHVHRNFTLFAPSNDAWAKVRHEMPTEYKQLTMGTHSYHVRKILDRHLVVGKQMSIKDLKRMPELQMIHGRFKIRPGTEASQGRIMLEWDGVEAQIVYSDLHALNGIVHVIDTVMMKKRDLTTAGSVVSCSSCSWAILLSTIILLRIYSSSTE